jgi:modulator of FtsH protease HflK
MNHSIDSEEKSAAANLSSRARLAVASFRWSKWHLLGSLLAVVLLDLAFTGIWTVQQNEQGVVLRFGRATRVCPAGIQFILPFPIETMEIVRTSEVRTLSVGFEVAEVGSSPGISGEDLQWLTGDTNIVEIKAVVQYVIKDPTAYLFGVSALSRQTVSGEEILDRDFVVRAAAESVLTSLVAGMRVDDVLSVGKTRLQEETRTGTQVLLDRLGRGLGVQVLTVNIVEGNPPAEVIAAFNDVSSARADKDRAVSEADGFSKDLLPKARARADGVVREAEMYESLVVNAARGSAERFRALAREVRLAPEVSRRRLWQEGVEEALAAARIVVYPSGGDSEFVLTELE